MHAGEVSSGGTRVIAAAVAQRKSRVLAEAREHQQVLAVRGQRGENRRKFARKLEIEAVGGGSPLVHQDAVRNINEGQAERTSGGSGRSRRGSEGRDHGVEQRERDGCAEASEERAAGKGFIHGRRQS